MKTVTLDPSDARPDIGSAKSFTTKRYIIAVRSTDDRYALDGYYEEEIDVPKPIYMWVKLLEEKIQDIQNNDV